MAAARQRLEQTPGSVLYVKHRRFLAAHRMALRPVAFGTDPRRSPLPSAQKAGLLVYDELTGLDTQSGAEDLLLDLFEYRMDHYLPTIITSNLRPADLESVLGSRLLDRFQPCKTVLLFGFESHRRAMSNEYAHRVAAFWSTKSTARPVNSQTSR